MNSRRERKKKQHTKRCAYNNYIFPFQLKARPKFVFFFSIFSVFEIDIKKNTQPIFQMSIEPQLKYTILYAENMLWFYETKLDSVFAIDFFSALFIRIAHIHSENRVVTRDLWWSCVWISLEKSIVYRHKKKPFLYHNVCGIFERKKRKKKRKIYMPNSDNKQSWIGQRKAYANRNMMNETMIKSKFFIVQLILWSQYECVCMCHTRSVLL